MIIVILIIITKGAGGNFGGNRYVNGCDGGDSFMRVYLSPNLPSYIH